MLERVTREVQRRAAPPARRRVHHRRAGRALRRRARAGSPTSPSPSRRRPRSPGTSASSATPPSPATCARRSTTPAAGRRRLTGVAAGEPVDDPGAAEAEPGVEVLRGAVGVGEEERELRRRPRCAARRDDRVGEPAAAVRRRRVDALDLVGVRRGSSRHIETGRPSVAHAERARAGQRGAAALPREHRRDRRLGAPRLGAHPLRAQRPDRLGGRPPRPARRAAGGGSSSAISRWRLTCQPAAAKRGRDVGADRLVQRPRRRAAPGSASRAANATLARRARRAVVSTRTTLTSRTHGTPWWNTAVPQGRGSVRSATASSIAHRCATMRSRSVVVVLVAAGAADHDLVLLDRDLDGAVAGPVLGVHGVVLDGGVEPQAVALLAVVERALERPGGLLAGAAAAARRARRASASPRLLRPRRPRPRPPCARPPRRPWPPPRRGGPPRPRAPRRSRRRPRRGGRPRRWRRPRRCSPSGSRPCSRLKAWICWTVTSSWWAIQASVRPCRTHPRIWLSCGRSDRRLMSRPGD